MIAYKLVRSDYTDLYSGTLKYEVGAEIAPPTVDESSELCRPGIHVCPTIRDALICGKDVPVRGRTSQWHSRPWRVLELEVDDAAIVVRADEKIRCRRVMVKREIPLMEAIESVLPGWPQRIERGRATIAGVREIRWLKPAQVVSQDEVGTILGKWHDAIVPFLGKRAAPPRAARIVTDREQAMKYADAADAAAADAADAAADAADAAAAADADAAAAAADAADAADADAAAAAADAADAHRLIYRRLWWHVRPQAWRVWRWAFAGLDPDKNPARWMLELWKLGLMPIGYVTDGKETFFAVYHPEVSK